MKIIGLTGGIASGKSSVAGLLEQFGASVIDADQLSRDVVMPGTRAFSAIVDQFGPAILDREGLIHRKSLGDLVFADPEARSRLESIVHPAIKHLAGERLAGLCEKGVEVAVYMAALLIEAGAVNRVDEVWVVYIDKKTQLERLMKRDGLSGEDALRRICTQMPMEEKMGYGKVVIDNSGLWNDTVCQVREAWEREVLGFGGRNPGTTEKT